jgi:NAD+ synthase (glutamine-hydrolysing)
MTTTLRIALAQINPIVGDLQGNADKIRKGIDQGVEVGADVVVFPELSLTGYPPEDLLLKPQFITDTLHQLRQIATATGDVVAIVGFADRNHMSVEEPGEGRRPPVFNAAAVLCRGEICGVYHKIFLPNYGVFDEKRYFEAGSDALVLQIEDAAVGLNICEDIWVPDGVSEAQVFRGGAEVILNISSSPYHAGKGRERQDLLVSLARRTGSYVAYANTVGGQDELVFDGQSFVIDYHGETIARAVQFEEDFLVADLDLSRVRDYRRTSEVWAEHKRRYSTLTAVRVTGLSLPNVDRKARSSVEARVAPALDSLAEIYTALKLGTRDYVLKNGFDRVLIGLSGGIDSSLTATIACDALGPQNVVGVLMPSMYTSSQSLGDAEALTKNLGIEQYVIPIRDIYDAYEQTLQPVFAGREPDVTEENIQARIRGNLLMALSNKFGWLVLTTGNKSEMSVGYATLYGDMAGGFAVLKDVPKTLVYELARHRNEVAGQPLIPESVLTKPPSAELRPNQTDQDTLPPYDLLDAILEEYVEKDRSVTEIIELGFSPDVVKKVALLVDRNEYKRRQAPPGVKITPKAFGRDRRMPITNRYQETRS